MHRNRSHLLLAFALGLAACADPPPPVVPVLVADPPLGATAVDEGAARSELQRAIAYIRMDRYADAKAHLEQSLATQQLPEAAYYLGLANEKLGDKLAAEEAYRLAMRLDPGFLEAAANLSALLLDEGPKRLDDAIAVLSEIAKRSPTDARILQNLGQAYAQKGDLERAGKAFEAALAKEDSPKLRFSYGTMLVEAGQLEKGAEHLRLVLKTAGDDVGTIATIGRLFGVAKAFQDCVSALDRAVTLAPKDPELWVRRGTCKHELGNEEAAVDDYRRAIKIDPKYAAAHYYLGVAMLAMGKPKTAQNELEQALELGRDSAIGKAALLKLAELQAKKRR